MHRWCLNNLASLDRKEKAANAAALAGHSENIWLPRVDSETIRPDQALQKFARGPRQMEQNSILAINARRQVDTP